MNLPPATLDTTAGMLSAGIAAARSGDETRARSLLTRVVKQDEHNATGWLWLSSVVDNLDDLEICLENVAILESENALVCQRLAGVKAQQAELRAAAAISRPIEPAAPHVIPPTTAPPEVSPASTTDQAHVLDVHRLFICPQCAGRMRFNPEIIDLQCQACGHIEVVDEVPAQPPEQALEPCLADGTRPSLGQRRALAALSTMRRTDRVSSGADFSQSVHTAAMRSSAPRPKIKNWKRRRP